jgi:uncharacterized repeat protein (TIGR03803 family)
MKWTLFLVLTFSPMAWTQQVPTVTILHQFLNNQIDGIYPAGPVFADKAGNLYGTTELGGDGSKQCNSAPEGCGIVYELVAPAWTEKILYNFTGGADGGEPMGGLAMDAEGNLYGTTFYGGDLTNPNCTNGVHANAGCGVVFELSQNQGAWTETVLHTFESTDGQLPESGLVFDQSGNLYGVTPAGGTYDTNVNGGVAYELSPSNGTWTINILHDFGGPGDGGAPFAALTIDGDGNLYGTTQVYGPSVPAIAFELQAQTWAEQILYSFPDEPTGILTFDPEGNLYGTTAAGAANDGTIYELSPSNGSWTETTLYTFTSIDDDNPQHGVIWNAGNLYGTAQDGGVDACGSIFEFSNGREQDLDWIQRRDKPCGPNALIFGGGGVYGTSFVGATKGLRNTETCGQEGCGTVFSVVR